MLAFALPCFALFTCTCTCIYTWICSQPIELPWWLSGYSSSLVSWGSRVQIPLRAVQLFNLILADFIYLGWIVTCICTWMQERLIFSGIVCRDFWVRGLCTGNPAPIPGSIRDRSWFFSFTLLFHDLVNMLHQTTCIYNLLILLLISCSTRHSV